MGEDFVRELLQDYGYLAILIITFLEGETIVILAGIACSQGAMSLPLVLVTALVGSFSGDQFYYTIGRRYGTRILDKWPRLEGKIQWAFRLVRSHETLFILSFRFIYGVRNISPFVIAMSGVPRLRFMLLNLIAAALWSLAFTFGGYKLGEAMSHFLGEHVFAALGVLASAAMLFAIVKWVRRRRDVRRMDADTNKELAPLAQD